MKKKKQRETENEDTVEETPLEEEETSTEQACEEEPCQEETQQATEDEQEKCEETCDDETCCDENCECHKENCTCQSDKASEYLQMAQRLQADFDNYRKRVAEQLDYQKQEGVKSVIEAFLPAIDSFSEAKKSVTDEAVLSGINMIEGKIMDALERLNVKKIQSVGEKFDPYLHNVIAVMADESKENDEILQEYQSGWTLNGKVIRYSKVVVNKKGE